MTPSAALERIATCRNNKLATLNLRGLQLTEIPKELSDLIWLEELDLSLNRISEIKSIEKLSTLSVLHLYNNQISEIKGLETLTNLIHLTLSRNRISEIKGLETLTNLSALELTENSIDEIKGLETLVNLSKLFLYLNQINEIKGLETLTNLLVLNLSHNPISEIKGLETLINLSDLYLTPNEISEIKGLETLTNLSVLNLSDNRISEIKGLETLPNLHQLYLSNNQIDEIKGLETLKNLSILFLSNNLISEIKGLETLHKLRQLILSSNQISEIRGLSIDQLEKMSSLDLRDNPIKSAQLSDLTDLQGIIGYLKSQRETLSQNRRLKVNILGAGRIGKTQLLYYFKKEPFVEDAPETHGTNTFDYSLPNSLYQAKIWDFGGQSYHHGFHYLFLRPTDFYIVLWRNSHQQESDYGYWLGTTRTFAKDADTAPLLLIQNIWNDKSEEYRKAFPDDSLPDAIAYPDSPRLRLYQLGLNDVFAIDIRALNQESPQHTYFLTELHARMKRHADSFDRISKKWQEVAEALDKANELSDKAANKQAIYLKRDEFKKRYAPDFDNDTFAGLLNYLEFTGNILYFREKARLNEYIFASPPKLSDWLFQTILDRDSMEKNGARISRTELADKHGEEESAIFFDLMSEFGLIFKKPHPDATDSRSDDSYIIPQFLPDYKHSFKEVLLKLLPFTFSLKFPDFMHEARIFQFIADYGPYAKDNTAYWKYGLLFGYEINRKQTAETPDQKQNDTVQVLVYYLTDHRQLMVHIEDRKGRSEIAREIFDYFVFDVKSSTNQELPEEHIQLATLLYGQKAGNSTVNKLRLSRKVENLKIPVYLSTNRPHYVDVAETMRNIEEHIYAGTCVNTQKRIRLDLMAINLLSNDNKRKVRVFFSYSHKDEAYRRELEVHLAMLKRSGRIETWHDREILTGDNWDQRIKEQLEMADITLLMISSDFLNSDYIWEHELSILRKRRDANDGVIVIPILTRPCDTKDFDEMKLQGAQRDQKSKLPWISSSPDRDQVYTDIVNEIRRKIDSVQ